MSHRENTQNIVENTPLILRVLPAEGLADILKGMEVTEEDGGYFVPLERASGVRTSLTQIKTYTDKEFTSCRVPARKGFPVGGINIWRLK